eukprot:TRINITY_DN1560_c0_g1_i2.p1 TRINITY_DN1560_c0_g1~~TRINITY_DN1560_c0_g1_i2.p1  ORF type:complete len:324 (-),score=65.77 TRINITY_DN1560_c0_g1_i2:9-848(-)
MEETARLCRAARSGVAVSCHVVDVGNKDRVNAFAQEVAVQYDGVVDMLFNNAGIGVGGPFEALTEEQFDRVIRINLNGVVWCTRAFLPMLKKSPEAYLVNISSVAGIVATKNFGPYATSKFGVRGFTEVLIQEFAALCPNVRAAVVHPGLVITNIINNSDLEASRKLSPFKGAEKLSEKKLKEFINKMYNTFGITSPEAARVILDGVRRDQTRIMVGYDAPIFDWWVRVCPHLHVQSAFFEQLMTVHGLVFGRLFTKEGAAAAYLAYFLVDLALHGSRL